MKKLILTQIAETPNSTVSKLTTDKGEFICFAIEDGFREVKEYGNTRIPAGTYQIKKRRYGRFYQRYKRRFNHSFVPQLVDVPRFTDILIHIGNTINDTKGCLLVNLGVIKGESGNWRGMSSTLAYKKLYKKLKFGFLAHNTIEIEVIRH